MVHEMECVEERTPVFRRRPGSRPHSWNLRPWVKWGDTQGGTWGELGDNRGKTIECIIIHLQDPGESVGSIVPSRRLLCLLLQCGKQPCLSFHTPNTPGKKHKFRTHKLQLQRTRNRHLHLQRACRKDRKSSVRDILNGMTFRMANRTQRWIQSLKMRTAPWRRHR